MNTITGSLAVKMNMDTSTNRRKGAVYGNAPISINVTPIYCILASCYIRLTLNICSFVRQCSIECLNRI
jgi:hypothetical protein